MKRGLRQTVSRRKCIYILFQNSERKLRLIRRKFPCNRRLESGRVKQNELTDNSIRVLLGSKLTTLVCHSTANLPIIRRCFGVARTNLPSTNIPSYFQRSNFQCSSGCVALQKVVTLCQREQRRMHQSVPCTYTNQLTRFGSRMGFSGVSLICPPPRPNSGD